AASSVMPRSLRERTWPRSTTRLPVQDAVHQSVPASPSIAFAARLADSDEVALACPDRAQSMVGPAPRPGSAGPDAAGAPLAPVVLAAPVVPVAPGETGEAAAPPRAATSGTARATGTMK